jgi:photosystem II stability/assembly factor-like uncharacterized protein
MDAGVGGSGQPRRTIVALVSALLLALVLAGCGQAQTIAAQQTPTQTPLPTPTSFAAHTPAPLVFRAQWTLAASLPRGLGNYAFAPSAPRTGYLCTIGSVNGSPVPPAFMFTSDGGLTWTSASTYPFKPGGCSVFVDQQNARDVFLQQYANATGMPITWRSQDGGTTWHVLAPIPATQGSYPWASVAVIGSRIIVAVGAINPGAGGQLPPNDLFASDDGGATWQQIAQGIAAQGQQVRTLIAFGTTLIVRSHATCANCAGDAAPLTGSTGVVPLAQPLSSGPPPNRYWRSTDGGVTWTEMSLPQPHIQYMRFARSEYGDNFVGVAFATEVDPSNMVAGALYYTTDGGTTWIPVPAINPKLLPQADPGSVGAGGNLAVLPDGSVVASFWQSVLDAGNALPDHGVLRWWPGAQSWMVLAPPATFDWQIGLTSQGTTLWAETNSGFGPELEYVTVPPAGS